MTSSKVAARYALSFLDTSIEKNTLEQVYKDFELVYSSLQASGEFMRFIKSPIIKNEKKQEIISEIFEDKISKESLEFLLFIASKNREDVLPEIITKFFDLRDEYLGIANVQVTTSFNFTPEQKEQLEKKFAKYLNKKVKISFTVDRKLIGGFVAKIGDTVYDASMMHQLELLKKQFLQGSITLN